MTPAHDPSGDDAALHRLSSRTTPTWEMELLISGATVFGLMQLPPHVDSALFGFYNTATPDVAGLVLPLWVYAKFMLLTLIATFIAHLALRGYWVALAGLASVYPGGVRWDKLEKRMGPLLLEATRRDLGDIALAIERADNRATRVFGVGYGLATMMLMPIVLVTALMIIVWLLWLADLRFEHTLAVGLAVFIGITMLFALVASWDKQRGAKAAPDSLEGRWLRAAMRAYAAMGFNRTTSPLLTLFSSNEGTSRTMMVIGGVMTAVFGFVAVQGVADRLGWSMGDYAGLPPDRRAVADTVLAEHYASQRSDRPTLRPPPHIPDPVVRGAYLRLFVPYFPQRHNDAMWRECPEAMAEEDAEKAARARLDCLERIHAVAIDGVPVDLHFDAAEDPKTGHRGMLAMIPMRDIAPGRHELTVMPPLRETQPAPGAKPITPYRIPFWR